MSNDRADNNLVDARGTLIGVALQLVVEMEADNGCRFFVSPGQATQLNDLCGCDPILSMPLSSLATLASGEHSDQERVMAAYGVEARDVYKLLGDVFENCEEPQS